jgi:sensor domain CHASE-containing protein
MDAKTLFYIGIIFGLIGGIVLTLIFVKVKSMFSTSEVRRLSREKKDLEKRLQEKDKYIDEMMGHAEKLAHNFTTQKRSEGKHS